MEVGTFADCEEELGSISKEPFLVQSLHNLFLTAWVMGVYTSYSSCISGLNKTNLFNLIHTVLRVAFFLQLCVTDHKQYHN